MKKKKEVKSMEFSLFSLHLSTLTPLLFLSFLCFEKRQEGLIHLNASVGWYLLREQECMGAFAKDGCIVKQEELVLLFLPFLEFTRFPRYQAGSGSKVFRSSFLFLFLP